MQKEDLAKMSVEEIKTALKEVGYFTSSEVALAIKNAIILEKPILIEGPSGVGKTALAKAISSILDKEMIRLQCTPEINERKALYEFDYTKQLFIMQMVKQGLSDQVEGMNLEQQIQHFVKENPFYSEDFLLKRPVLQAFSAKDTKVLLIDEIDKASEEFEYSLLEAFSDYTVTIPELKTVEAAEKPITIITSNNVRRLSEAFSRRCLYLYVDYPNLEDEVEIVVSKVKVEEDIAKRIVGKIQELRNIKLAQSPSIAETIEWSTVIAAHMKDEDDLLKVMRENISVVSKNPSDREKIMEELSSETEAVEVKVG